MKINEYLKKISVNQKLAGVVILLGFIAFIIGSPISNTIANVNGSDLAVMVEKGADKISVSDLSDWIIQGKVDYRLIDLRGEIEYSEYSIPGSENVQISDLAESDIPKNQMTILYSANGIESSQAWFLLKAKKYQKVYMLSGGINEWKEKILFPKLPADANETQKLEFNKLAEVSKYFGGSPQTGTTEATVSTLPTLPKLQLQTLSAPAGGKKKKREGC